MPTFYPLETKLREEGHFFIAGVDEAGRGPMAGPLVVAAVILKEHTKLTELNDSKILSEKKRQILFPKIIKASIDFSITVIPNQIIDKINILEATRLANKLCLDKLNKLDIAIMDGRDKQTHDHNFINIIKGDKYIKSIAAASVLAKVTRDSLMYRYDEIYPKYFFKSHKGYGTSKHREAIKNHGLSLIHRKSFKFKK